jgi:hypothetical protein
MIITDTTTNKKVLEIFERFNIDRNLPKYTERTKVKEVVAQFTTVSSINSTNNITFTTSDNNWIGSVSAPSFNNGATTILNNSSEKIGLVDSLISKFKSLFSRKKLPANKIFVQVFENLGQIAVFKEREELIEATLAIAKKNGQTALVEKIKELREIHLLESQLFALDFIKVITEEQMVKFAYDCERGLRLDWIQNFTRSIPEDVIKQKEKADSLKLFDNYVILHYDPLNKSNQLTKEEIEKKKDPILFGVFKESRKLYYIGDWKDELCDLTFDQLIDKIGADALTIKKKAI